jgi:nucleoid-associated protein YgaU
MPTSRFVILVHVDRAPVLLGPMLEETRTQHMREMRERYPHCRLHALDVVARSPPIASRCCLGLTELPHSPPKDPWSFCRVTAPPEWPTPNLRILVEPSRTVSIIRNVPRSAQAPAPAEARGRDPAPGRTYQVRCGDSLSSIASEAYGDASEWQRIYEANRGSFDERRMFRVGQVTTVPGQRSVR